MRQIDIVELKEGHYTFQVDRFGTEHSAVRSANKLAQSGLDQVKITYIN